MAIIKNKYTSSSGSLIAALNLTIDKAPTSPKDRANELFTIIITMQVVTPNMTKFFEILEGPVGIMDCYFDSNCEQLNGCNIREPINRINDNIRTMFNKMTLADITY